DLLPRAACTSITPSPPRWASRRRKTRRSSASGAGCAVSYPRRHPGVVPRHRPLRHGGAPAAARNAARGRWPRPAAALAQGRRRRAHAAHHLDRPAGGRVRAARPASCPAAAEDAPPSSARRLERAPVDRRAPGRARGPHPGEAECATAEALAAIPPPPFALREVSDEPAYTGAWRVEHGLPR